MKLSKIRDVAEDFTDETITDKFAIAYADKALAIVNTKCGLLLPFFDDEDLPIGIDDDYTALTKSWARQLLIPFLCYGIKMNDTSLAEAERYLNEFYGAVLDFRDGAKNVVDAEYVDPTNVSVYALDPSNNIDMGWFGGLDSDL